MRILDLTDVDALEMFVKELPEIHGCVNNAGIGGKQPIAFIKREELQHILNTNALAPIYLTQFLIKKKKMKRGSSMVFTSSISGVYSVDIGNAMYSMTKSAIDGFMKNAAIELAVKGIRVNSVNPGMVDTPINDIDSFTEEQNKKILAIIHLNVMDYPMMWHGGLFILLSDASSWVTGTSLKIDGGYSL